MRKEIRYTGLPIAKTFWPTSKSADLPTGKGRSFSQGASMCNTATSLSSSNPTTSASYTVWSPNVTLTWTKLPHVIHISTLLLRRICPNNNNMDAFFLVQNVPLLHSNPKKTHKVQHPLACQSSALTWESLAQPFSRKKWKLQAEKREGRD